MIAKTKGCLATVNHSTRIKCLDGLRGLMTIFVVVSHYFAELPGGIHSLAIGWLAVDMFFVLSGFLVGRLILDKSKKQNFWFIFYIRRVCRTFPIYFFCTIGAYLILSQMPAALNDAEHKMPFWTYLTFTQNIAFAIHKDMGENWLSPTWTMGVEEQFYLLAPAVMIFAPRRHLFRILLIIAFLSMLFRFISYTYNGSALAAMTLLPGRADSLSLGLAAAVLYMREHTFSLSFMKFLRIAPLFTIILMGTLGYVYSSDNAVFVSLGKTIIVMGCAFYILAMAKGAPESKTMENKILYFFGRTSFAVYLTHMPVLWLMHGIILKSKPAMHSKEQLVICLATVPMCLLVSWILTKIVEEPITAYGRSFKWK